MSDLAKIEETAAVAKAGAVDLLELCDHVRDVPEARELLNAVQTELKRWDGERKKITDPLWSAYKAANKHFQDGALTVLEQAKKKLKGFIAREVDAQRQQREERLAIATTETDVQEALATVVEDAKTRSIPRVKIVDAAKIPRDCLAPKLDEILERLLRKEEVPGCELVYETSVIAG